MHLLYLANIEGPLMPMLAVAGSTIAAAAIAAIVGIGGGFMFRRWQELLKKAAIEAALFHNWSG